MRIGRLQCWLVGLVVLVLGLGTGCHREEVTEVPLLAKLISFTDRFFDVRALDANNVVVGGYGGKILLTTDGGLTWSRSETGTDRAIYKLDFVDKQTGWAVGQEGLILHTNDGGKTWARQNSNTVAYLFGVDFRDRDHGFVIGDKSLLLETRDGGTTWTVRKLPNQAREKMSQEEALLAQDPVLYDIGFADDQHGWIVGEFGKISYTADGGQTWNEQQETLLGGDIIDMLSLPTLFGVDASSAQLALAVGLDGRLARTMDGSKWSFDEKKLDYPILDPLFSAHLLPDGTGWAVGGAGEVLFVSAPGQPWERRKVGMEIATWMRGMDWLDKDHGWIVGGKGLILHTSDGGKTWVPSLG
jgi:photosystem II stability/assembly factor-like uncharacterized protein